MAKPKVPPSIVDEPLGTGTEFGAKNGHDNYEGSTASYPRVRSHLDAW